MSTTIFKRNRSKRVYSVANNLKPIDAIVADSETLRRYSLKQYNSIFPDYGEKDDIHLRQYEGENILVHMRPNLSEKGDDLPAGVYRVEEDDYGDYELKIIDDFRTDDYILLSNSRVNELQKDIDLFFNNKEKYDSLNLMYKRGCLLYGPPGNGKTLGIQKVIAKAVNDYNAVALLLAKGINDFGSLLDVRDSLKGRPVVFVMEEITERIESGGIETFLNFLDGEYAWEHTYHISTTNYPELLPANIAERPSRYDLVLEVDNPNRADRVIYLQKFIGSVTDEVADKTEGFSTAFLKEVALRSLLYERPIIEVVNELEELKSRVRRSFKKSGKDIGFF